MAHPALEYINTAVTLASFLVSQDLQATAENVRSFFRRNPSDLANKFEQTHELAFVAKLVIDPELLEELSGSVADAIGEEVDCYSKATTPQKKDACARKAEKSVCDSLNRIKDRNNDDLPTSDLYNAWESYRCERV